MSAAFSAFLDAIFIPTPSPSHELATTNRCLYILFEFIILSMFFILNIFFVFTMLSYCLYYITYIALFILFVLFVLFVLYYIIILLYCVILCYIILYYYIVLYYYIIILYYIILLYYTVFALKGKLKNIGGVSPRQKSDPHHAIFFRHWLRTGSKPGMTDFIMRLVQALQGAFDCEGYKHTAHAHKKRL